jgi:hypothetical protein
MENMTTANPAPRIPLQMDVEYRRSYARRREKGRLKNISISGAFIELPESTELMPNDKVLITLLVSGRERKIHAHVVWNGHSGCGIKFLPTNNRDIQIVDDLMYFVENSRSSQRAVLDSIFKRVA